jgi:hypothetical protein
MQLNIILRDRAGVERKKNKYRPLEKVRVVFQTLEEIINNQRRF